jgi:hypothetical protein
MNANGSWKVGECATHKTLGNCVIRRLFPASGAAWVEVWGGPCGDKLMLFKGQRIEDLAPRPAYRQEGK